MALVINNRYHLVARLGSGGMGVVHLGWDVVLERYVAVKQVRSPVSGATDGAEALRAFREEAQLVAGFRHPGIVGVFDFGIDADGVYIVTEVIEGFDLERLVQTRSPCNELAAALIGYEVSGALHAAHAARIIHRDVKPSNIMVDSSGRVLLMDFGIALRGDRGSAQVRGTPLYMAPEQFEGTLASTRTDLWGLGCTLVWLLTGKPPVAARTLVELNDRLRNGQWEPELDALLDRGGAMSRVVGGCLEQDPGRRFGDAKILQGALGQVIQASLVPDPREELSRVAREWLEEMGDAVFRIPSEPPSEDLALGETLEAPGPATPVAATPRLVSHGDGLEETDTFGGTTTTGPLRQSRERPLIVLWILLVVLALSGAIFGAGRLLGPGADSVREEVLQAPDAGTPTEYRRDLRGVAMWVHDHRCPNGRAAELGAAAQRVIDRWPEVEMLGPAVIQGLLESEGPVTDADLLALGATQGWRILVTGRCGTLDGHDRVTATIYDLRWDPPLRAGGDVEIDDADEDGQFIDRWRRLLTSRIWTLLPMGCEGDGVEVPSRETARLVSKARALIPRYTREDLDEALRLVDEALQQTPGALEARLVKARLQVVLVDRFAADPALLDSALNEAAAVAEVCPDHRRLHGLRAIIHAKSGDSGTAIRLLEEGLERYPTDPVSWNLLAVELGIVGRAQDKVDALRRVLGRDPRDWNARINLGYTMRQLGDLQGAAREYRRVLEGGANLDEQLWARDGLLWTALSRGDLDAAGRARDALLGERAEHWTLESAAAAAWFEGRCEDTVRLGDRARVKSPGAWIGALWTVAARRGAEACGGRGAGAAVAEEIASDCASWPATGLLTLGLVLEEMGRTGAAEATLKRLGSMRRGLAAEAAAVLACREGNAAAALAQVDRALAEDPADAATLLRQRAWKVRILGSLGRYDEALELAAGCRDLVAAPDWWMIPGQPPRPEAWAAVLALREPGRARALADIAVRYVPLDMEAWLALGLAARAQGDLDAEAEARRRYRRLNPAPEWMERRCGGVPFDALRRLADEWSGI